MRLSPIPQPKVGMLAVLLLILSASSAFGSTSASLIKELQVRPDSGEIEINVEGNIEYGYFPLSEPNRLVFDFPGTILGLESGFPLEQDFQGGTVRQVRLSQFSADPPIARLVIFLNNPASPVVSFNPEDGKLLITVRTQVDTATSGDNPVGLNMTELLNSTSEVPNVNTSTRQATSPITPDGYYQITKTDSEVLIRFPGLTTDDVTVERLRFPDRFHIRIYTTGPDGIERPRFDPLSRGNIWNSVAKTWASFIDRDGRGIIDVTIYTYENVGYNQSIASDGTPEIRLIASETLPINAGQEIPFAELEVSSYNSNEHESEPVSILSFSDNLEVIENAALGIPQIQFDVLGEADTELIADANLPISGRLPTLPLALEQNAVPMGPEPLYLRVGDVIIVPVADLIRASMGNPLVAALNVISREEIIVTALAPGSTSLVTWESDGSNMTREIHVLGATAGSEREISNAINNPDISVRVLLSGDSSAAPGVILEGPVATEEERMRAEMIASLFAGDRVTNLIEVLDPRQVLVQVRVVEINKRALDEQLSQFSASAAADNDDFTFNIITDLLDPENPGGGLFDSRVRPGIVNGNMNDVVFDPIDMVLNQLVSDRKATVLSQPNVVSMSGHAAHFRVGGEVPYTYQNENGVTVVEFKEFGIVLDMTPYVDSRNNIMLTVAPTVRTIDLALAIAGIPGFRTREMSTQVQLKPGETLVIGGLIQNEITEIVSRIPILSDIPILGELFRSRRFNEDETELVIFLTPHILETVDLSEDLIGVHIDNDTSD